VSYKTIQRHLAKIQDGGYRDLIGGKCLAHASETGGLGLLLYDVTTLYFEAEKEDDLRKVGYSNYAEVPVMPRSGGRAGIRAGRWAGRAGPRGITAGVWDGFL
jgi:hypothetical protein